MKTLSVVFLLAAAHCVIAQTAINKTVPFQVGQKIEMHFDYPELVRVSTWDKNEISVVGTVSINNGENDSAFELITNTAGLVSIRNEIRDMKNLPHRITVVRDGEKMTFKTKADYKKWADQHGQGYNMMSDGVDIDIFLEIKVPRNAVTRVESVYGMVEVKDFTGPLTVDATYGGIDATVTPQSIGELSAETNYGQIYTNLDLKFSGDNVRQEDFHTLVTAKVGTGPKYSLESKYGNVYLRKSKN